MRAHQGLLQLLRRSVPTVGCAAWPSALEPRGHAWGGAWPSLQQQQQAWQRGWWTGGRRRLHSDAAAPAFPEAPLDSVIKIFSTICPPDHFQPWQNKPQRESTGSGFVIDGRRVVTNAHLVADASFLMVRSHGSSTKYVAQVEAVGHECDLALLSVEDAFWEESGAAPLPLGGVPELQESVAVVGYQEGGDNVSVTRGVVSRVEPTQYAHAAAHLLWGRAGVAVFFVALKYSHQFHTRTVGVQAIQLDTAINPGNSGGPAFLDGKVVGVAFQNVRDAENMGYIIPVPILERFLEDVRLHGAYCGATGLGITCQSMENNQLHQFCGLPKGNTGVLISRVQPCAAAAEHLQKGDVLLAVDGVQIANDGTVLLRRRERVFFDYLVSLKRVGDIVRLDLWRQGQRLSTEMELLAMPSLVPVHQYDTIPSYFIFAGLVFTRLTQAYLHEYGEEWLHSAPRALVEYAIENEAQQPGEEVVIVSQVLAASVNVGYQGLVENARILSVNEEKVLNLQQLYATVQACESKFLRFNFEDDTFMVLSTREAKAASARILARHRIPYAASNDLVTGGCETSLLKGQRRRRLT